MINSQGQIARGQSAAANTGWAKVLRAEVTLFIRAQAKRKIELGMHNLALDHRRKDLYWLLAVLMLVAATSGCVAPQRSQNLYPVSEADGLVGTGYAVIASQRGERPHSSGLWPSKRLNSMLIARWRSKSMPIRQCHGYHDGHVRNR